MGQLSALEADPRVKTVSVRGRTLEVRPLPLSRIPSFVRLASPVIDAVFRMRKTDAGALSADELSAVLPLVETHLPQIAEALATALAEDVADINQLNAGEATQLVCLVLEVNLDFFTSMAIPALGNLAVMFMRLTPKPSSRLASTPRPS